MTRGGNPRAVLAAVVAATGPGPAGQALCAALLDAAGDLLVSAPADVLSAAGGCAEPVGRLAGIALLGEICGACGLCARGQLIAADEELAKPPTLGPIARQRLTRRWLG